MSCTCAHRFWKVLRTGAEHLCACLVGMKSEDMIGLSWMICDDVLCYYGKVDQDIQTSC